MHAGRVGHFVVCGQGHSRAAPLARLISPGRPFRAAAHKEGEIMPHYPKSRPVADIGYLADLLAEMETLARRQRRPLLAFLIGMARLEAEGKVIARG